MGRSARILLAAVGVVAVVVVALAIGGVFDGDDDDAGDDGAVAALGGATEDAGYQNSEDDLYTISAAGGGIRRAGDGLRITLRAPGRSVLQFADRPLRQAERLTLRELVRRWDALGFAQDPPNASLDVAGTADDETLALEIERPRLRGDSVEFTARVLSGGDSRLARSRSFGAASLFIDPSGNTTSDAGTPSCGTTGEIVIFAGNFVPQGMVVANATYRKADLPDLFRLVGSRFGKPSDSANFVTPGLKPIDARASSGGGDPRDALQGRLLTAVCAAGSAPTPPPSDPSAVADGPGGCTVGEVRYTGLAGPHAGWLPADGRTLGADEYPLLAASLGSTADGKNVALPKVAAPAVSADVAPDAQICVHGVNRTKPSQCPTGSLRLFAGPLVRDMVVPAGQLVSINANQALFSIFWNRFGGNLQTSIAWPSPPPAPAGLRWVLCGTGRLPGTYPYRSDLDPNPKPGVVSTLDLLQPCEATTGGFNMVLPMKFKDELFATFVVDRVVDHCEDPVRTFVIIGGDRQLVVHGKRGSGFYTGQFILAGEPVADLAFDEPGASGRFTGGDAERFCKFLGDQVDNCTPDQFTGDGKFTGEGTFTLAPAMDAVGPRRLYGPDAGSRRDSKR